MYYLSFLKYEQDVVNNYFGQNIPSKKYSGHKQKVKDKDIADRIEELILNDDISAITFRKYPFKNNDFVHVKLNHSLEIPNWREKIV